MFIPRRKVLSSKVKPPSSSGSTQTPKSKGTVSSPQAHLVTPRTRYSRPPSRKLSIAQSRQVGLPSKSKQRSLFCGPMVSGSHSISVPHRVQGMVVIWLPFDVGNFPQVSKGDVGFPLTVEYLCRSNHVDRSKHYQHSTSSQSASPFSCGVYHGQNDLLGREESKKR